MPFPIQPRPFLKYNPCSRDQIHSLFKRKHSSLLFPVPACDVLIIPPSKSLALFPCLIESSVATSHCFDKQLQVINVPLAAKTPTFQNFCLFSFHCYIDRVLPTDSLSFR